MGISLRKHSIIKQVSLRGILVLRGLSSWCFLLDALHRPSVGWRCWFEMFSDICIPQMMNPNDRFTPLGFGWFGHVWSLPLSNETPAHVSISGTYEKTKLATKQFSQMFSFSLWQSTLIGITPTVVEEERLKNTKPNSNLKKLSYIYFDDSLNQHLTFIILNVIVWKL